MIRRIAGVSGKMKVFMKDADAKLIDLLRANAREPTASLARKLGLARSTVQERLARLEREGVVKGYTVRLADEAQANRLRAVVMIETDPKQADRVSVGAQEDARGTLARGAVGQLRPGRHDRDRDAGAHRRASRPHRPCAGRGADRVSSIILSEKFAR